MRLAALITEIPKAREALDNYEAHLRVSTPWPLRIFRKRRDATLATLQMRHTALWLENDGLRLKLEHIPFQIQQLKKTQKRYVEAKTARADAGQRAREQERQRSEFDASSLQSLEDPFDRSLFHIQSRDYRRGNLIDNYCRKALTASILLAFGESCAFCGTKDSLTFDHYAITKNQGGNFVLVASDKRSIRVNLVVLCRSCNSIKAQRSHSDFFDAKYQQVILQYQERLLSVLLKDHQLMKLLKRWAK